MVRLLLGRTRQVRPVQAPSWETPQVRTLPDLAPLRGSFGKPAESGNEPAYWDLGNGAVVLHGGVLHVLNDTARALWVEINSGADADSAVVTIADAWQVDPDSIRQACLRVFAELRRVAAEGTVA